MPTRVAINGTIHPPETAMVSVFDRGFLYGDSVFEVLRTYAGAPFALEEHLGRLSRSAQYIGMSLPVAIAQLRLELERTLAEAAEPDAYVRIVVTRGAGELGLDPSLARDPMRVIIVQALRAPPRALYVDGIAVITMATVTRSTDPNSTTSAKTSNYLSNILALRTAKQRGAHEAILVAADGSVLEGTTSNLFIIADGALVTPALDAGILPGITREHVLDAARSIGLAVHERRMSLADVWTADEVFITSSLREVVPVVRVDDHEVGANMPGAVTRRIHTAFRSRTPARSLPMPWL